MKYVGPWTSEPFRIFRMNIQKNYYITIWLMYRKYGTKQFTDLTRTRTMLSTDYLSNC
eukprot:UN07458